MTKHAWPVALLACAWLLSGCGEVDSCRERETPGCLNSAPLASGGCLFDLVRRNDICVKPGSPEDFCSFCDEGALCVPEENRCVNYCEAPTTLPRSVKPPEPIFCRATQDPNSMTPPPMLSFEEVCKRRCRLDCQRKEQFCTGYVCPADACDKPEVLAQCATDCPPTAQGQRDLACITQRCNDKSLARCSSALCPAGFTASCENVTCTNDCSSGDAGPVDGLCDDGDPTSSDTALCAWGSDCADCGPRRGSPPPSTLGSVCAHNENCAGGTGRPSTAESWCINIDGIPGLSRCAPDCSRDADACPEGFLCKEALFPEGDVLGAPPVRRVDQTPSGTVSSSACVPMMCSG